MQIDFRGINTPRDLQEFHLPSGDPGDYWWPRAQMRLQVVWLPVEEIDGPQPGMAPHRREGWPEIWIKEDKQAFFFWRHGLSLSLNLEEGRAEARISYKNDWQSILRILYFFGFLEERGLLLHASGLVHRGLAYIFPGVSGAGKTTIVRLSPQLPLLSDEISAVQLTENSRVLGHGTPFFGDLGHPGEKVTVPVKGLYFPVKAEENRVVPLTLAEAASHLLSCVCAYTTDAERLRKIFDLSHQLLERLPGYLLYFRPEPDFWRALDES